LDLSSPYRVPLSWLLEHGSESVRLRTLRELAPPAQAGANGALDQAVLQSKAVHEIVKRQADDGSWGGNLLGVAPSVREGIREPGTVPQYRRLLQLGYPHSGRAFKLGDRLLFRLLSRDEDPSLLFEFEKLGRESQTTGELVRERNREAATAALAEGGHGEDPRVRGSAHRIASAVSAFLRSPLSEKPWARSAGTTILHPVAHPPTWYSLAMLAAMPNLQRERAGFTERLGQYLSTHAPKKAYTVHLGKKSIKPTDILLGDPTEADSKGTVKDIPLALHFYEQLARLGMLTESVLGARVLSRLESECDAAGVWHPKKLNVAPKALHSATYHSYPLGVESKTPDGRMVDVSFRLALIAKLVGRPLEYT
jgi:hypothetical protein